MTAELDALDEWLERHAPDTRRTLRPGVDAAGLAVLERGYGFKLHPQLRTLLGWHDGGDDSDLFALQLWPDFFFEQSAWMLERHRASRGDENYDPRWVPIATDHGLAAIVVDHGEVPGRVLFVDIVDGVREERTRPSLAGFMAEMAAALRNAASLGGRHPAVEDGRLRWAGAE